MSASHRRGFALLMTMWLLVPLSMLFLLLTGAARSNGQVAANLRDAATLQAAADGGIETAILGLLASRSTSASDRVSIGTASVGLTIVPLSGLVNPNLASQELMRALLVRAGLTPARANDVAAGIVEWRTPGQRGRDGQDKAAEYRAAGLNYGPPGAPFESIDELRDVIGMPPATVAVLRPVLSLFTNRLPDPAIAPPLVRLALGDLGTVPRGGGNGGSVFRITAVATAASRARATVTRSAVIQVAASGGGRPWSVLAWGSDLAGQ